VIGDDLASGRLIAPFDIYMPAAGAYYLVYPEDPGIDRNGAAFREWLLEEMAEVRAGQPDAAVAAFEPAWRAGAGEEPARGPEKAGGDHERQDGP
jgi:DNA-binding transcriptional LysR family regulator